MRRRVVAGLSQRCGRDIVSTQAVSHLQGVDNFLMTSEQIGSVSVLFSQGVLVGDDRLILFRAPVEAHGCGRDKPVLGDLPKLFLNWSSEAVLGS